MLKNQIYPNFVYCILSLYRKIITINIQVWEEKLWSITVKKVYKGLGMITVS